MADNPYRFTVKVEAGRGERFWWVHVILTAPALSDDDGQQADHIYLMFRTEAEANEHADMILAALKGATRE